MIQTHPDLLQVQREKLVEEIRVFKGVLVARFNLRVTNGLFVLYDPESITEKSILNQVKQCDKNATIFWNERISSNFLQRKHKRDFIICLTSTKPASAVFLLPRNLVWQMTAKQRWTSFNQNRWHLQLVSPQYWNAAYRESCSHRPAIEYFRNTCLCKLLTISPDDRITHSPGWRAWPSRASWCLAVTASACRWSASACPACR